MKRTSLLVVLVAATAAASAQESRPQPAADRMTPELLWKLKRVSDPCTQHDGMRVLYSVRTYDLAKNKGESQVFLFDAALAKHRQLTSKGSNWSARWSRLPDSVALLSTASGKPQICMLQLPGNTIRQVSSHPGGVDNMVWSADGGTFLFTARVEVRPDPAQHPDLPLATGRIYDDLMVRHWDRWRDSTRSHLFVQSAGGGAARDLMAGLDVDTPLPPFGGAEQIALSPDGKFACYTARADGDEEKSTNSDLFLVATAGGPHRNLTKGMPGYDMEPSFSPDGNRILFLSMPRGGFESDRTRLMLYDRGTESIAELSVDWDMAVHEATWSPTGDTIYFCADRKGERHLFRLKVGEPEPVQVSSGRFHFASPAPSAGGPVYCLRQNTERPHELVTLPPDAPGQGQPCSDHNAGIYAGLALPKIEARYCKATDGKDIHSWVITPPNFDKQKKWPLLLYCQGGPQSQVGQWFSYRWNFHLMAAQGYVVLAPNRRGLPGFGRAWNDAISRDWGGQAMRDLLSACDDICKEDYIDKDRVAAIGASFGGYSVYWLMGNDDRNRFAAMIAHCGVFNLESMYLGTEEQFFVNWDLGGPYWTSPERQKDYDRFSPHRFVGNWKTPLLVIHGQKDFRVPLTEGLQAFTAAQIRGVPSRFLYFPDEGHWVQQPQNGVLWHRVFFDWLGRHCKSR